MKIKAKKTLIDNKDYRIISLRISSPHIASCVKPGQFIVVMVKAKGERIPLTVVDAKNEEITLIFQEAGYSTKLLGNLNEGDSVYALVGPLGCATEIKNYGKVILVAGGVGIAEIYPVAKRLKEEGNYIVTILGTRTKDLLFLEEELRGISDEIHITTDDGSYSRKGFTTDVLKDILSKAKFDLVYAVGPIPMMEIASSVTKEFGVRTMVSLNTLMLDATGMCGCCRVSVDNIVKFACVDGPEFDAHLIDWDELKKRNRIYEEKEKHICRLSKL
ncbi:MAG: sulfide/dihydroorotate dehydrogenase-like FAD/NAD-binding protein [Candidatus Omnitrophica bacterium]|nr:sulfide/dihydroorotate dehydrogenase-like FAD/NAD-binding protein [Candidatus Omnitrophota bacterium]